MIDRFKETRECVRQGCRRHRSAAAHLPGVSWTLLAILAGAFIFALPHAVSAQNWPSKPIRMLVPNGAGSSPDLLTRMWAEHLSKAVGQNVLVENNVAGSGLVAAQTAAHAPADGYTLFLATVVTHATNPNMFKSLPYDPVKDFAPVAILMDDGPYIVAVHPDVKAKDFGELMALARSQPGKLSFAADAGLAGIAGRWMFKTAGVDILHIPYKEIPPSLQDTISGRVPIIIISLAAAGPFVKSGKLRLVGVTSSRRFPGVETVPSVAETVPGVKFGGWFTIAAPAGTPAAVVQRVNRITDEFLKIPGTQEKIQSFGWFASGAGTPQSTAEFIRVERERWGKTLREVGVEPQ